MNDERNLTSEQQKTLDLKRAERERVQDINKELVEKRDKIKGEDYQTKKDELERDTKNLKEKIRIAKENNKRIEEEIFQATSMTRSASNDPYDLYKITVPGGDSKVVNYYQLNNLIIQVLTYFSYLDCPFKDE